MTERESFEVFDARLKAWGRCGGYCEVCGAPMDYNKMQLAHRIPQNKRNLKTYGAHIIHSPLNMRAVCSLECNDIVSISNHQLMIALLIAEIKDALDATQE